jgi:predicted 2-oxoglutarate/Fe(II)-dependent dioxygenase YbiX
MAGNVEPQVLNVNAPEVARRTSTPLVLDGFLDAGTCRRVRLAMDAGTPEPAEVLDADVRLDERVRHATLIEVDDETRRLLERHVDAVRPRVADHFCAPVTEREGLGIARYPDGGFFKPHRDRGEVASWPGASRRRIAVVVFLNSCQDVDAAGAFTGGALRLFDDDGQGWLDIHPRGGTLVAFPATTLHEVRPVRGGMRDAIVDWFY